MKREYIGLVAPVIAFVTILIAIYFNSSWWTLTDNAISDLGNICNDYVKYPWILSFGFIISGIMLFYYFVTQINKFKKLTKVGMYIILFGLFSFILIGVFPECTLPHWYVSWLFFVLSSIGVFIFGISMVKTNFGIFSVSIFSIGWVLGAIALHVFTGVAIAELIGGVVISTWVYVFILMHNKLYI